MIHPKPIFFYTAYGLTIKSELTLPELCSIENVSQADISILFADLSGNHNLNKLKKNRYYWNEIESTFYLHIAETAKFLVKRGKTILVQAIADPANLNIRIHLLGSCMGVLMQQRNILPLHASSISKGKECIIISGQIGSGKSTLAMALNKKGYPLLADDICALHFSDENIPYVYPSIPQIKIGVDSANALRINSSSLTSTFSKHIIPICNKSKNRPHTVRTIFSIEQSNSDQLKIQELHGARKLAILVKNSYTSPEIRHYLRKTKTHFKQCSILAKSNKVKQIYRPNGLHDLPTVISVIVNEFSGA